MDIDQFQRPIDPGLRHPIHTGSYLISTREIEKLYEQVLIMIDNRTPGGLVYGRPRLGKTRALRFIQQDLKEERPHLPVFTLPCQYHGKATESIFFEELLQNIGHGLSLSGSIAAKRNRFNQFLLQEAYNENSNQILLFLDDANRLEVSQYECLMDIHNFLDQNNVSLTAILVGQEDLFNRRSSFLQSQKHQIIGRFMVHTHKFEGVKTHDTLYYCLESYDNHSEFPHGSGWSFTRYFFPDQYQKGFRLSNYSKTLFDIFLELRQLNNKKNFEIPMQYITLTIEYFLKNFGIENQRLGQLTDDCWLRAIQNSGYINAEVLLNATQNEKRTQL